MTGRARARMRSVAFAGVAGLVLASCGGSGSGATGDVIVTLKDFSLTATPGTFAPGPISFGIDNDGPSVHEFVVLRTDDAPDALPVENGRWRIRADLQHFRQLTMGHALLVGRVTQESILRINGGPLAGRHTVVLTRRADVEPAEGVTVAHTLDDAWDAAEKYRADHGQGHFFVAGGAQVYAETLARVDRAFLTRVHRSPDGDARMPAGWLGGFRTVSSRPLDDEDGSPLCTFLELARVS